MATTSNPAKSGAAKSSPAKIDLAKIKEVRDSVDRLYSEGRGADRLMEGITDLLNEQMLKYNWVGFYMLEEGTTPPVLV
ncbi:MAG: hypothetical protein WBZ01_07710, partial [Terriglobales bacterium]